MKYRSYYTKIVISTVVLLLFVAFVLSQFNRWVDINLESTATTVYTELVSQQQNSFNQQLDRERDGLESISKAIIEFGYDEETFFSYVDSVKEEFHYENLTIVDIEGKGFLNGELIDISDRDYFMAAVKGETITSEPYLCDETDKMVIAVAAPIYYEGYVQGIITAEYDTDTLSALLASSVSEQGQALIVNGDGEILMNTKTEQTGLFPFPGTVFTGSVDSTEVQRDFNSYGENIFTYSLDERDYYAIYLPLEVNSWSLVYILPEEIVRAHVNEIFILTLIVSLIIITIFIVLIIYILVSKRRNLERIEKIAYYDELTGIRNLAKFKIDVAEVLHNNPDKQYYMVKGDIVNFKAINELFDFNVGNEVLKTIANVGREMTFGGFIQARMNSDEFIMFAEGEVFEDMEKTSMMYESRFKEMLKCADGHQISFRLGRYRIEKGECDIDGMISNTNLAHSFAKTNTSKLIWDYDDSFKERLLKATEITNRMEGALNREEFRVYLQPKYSVSDKKIIAAEALVRWIDFDGNITYPNDFIPLFERNGFIIELDKYMLEKVCKMMRSWHDSGRELIPVSVNFSRNNLKNPDFAHNINAIVQRYEIPTKYIEIELTETGLEDNEKELENIFIQLKEQGFLVSIDDFGSGYSSLGMLKEFRADTLKLDRSFFVNHKDDERGNIVVDEVIRLSGRLDMFTVAEGIEDEDQHGFLRKVGCDAAQGYFYAKPMPIHEFEKLFFEEQ